MIHASISKHLHGANGDFQLEASLNIAEGEFVALFGASGVGKTTLLRCIAGLEQPEQGSIVVRGETWLDSAARLNLPPQQRRVGYMFQDYALFPNMTVRGNLEFALRKGTDQKRINELLELMALGELQHRKPDSLSGGQKQRVALARALASEPRLLLLDEPFSALDAEMRSRLHDEILRLQKHFGITTVIVSHDVSEVCKLTSRVMMMEAGRIVQQGRPVEVFSAGQTSGKFRFTGEILAIESMDVMFSLTVLVGNQIVRVVAMPDEAAKLHVGERVMLVSKAFNPMVLKLEQ
ncbi:sulfate/thiosulfate import ATP-binding protein CysA [mine drainage metagenome]|uniref:Sulfate/thiosulfate import ATP-binding protein CysA n=1 Tax=mine drainage metagenome TaxID=410659 RepID=A0A1J5TAI4_9ZZZZ